MKLITLLLIVTFSMQALSQWPEINYDTITFEDSTDYISIDNSIQNIWQIGSPSKLFLDSAYSTHNVIITDTLNNYPINCNSYFDLYISNFGQHPYNIGIEFKHKFDTDTLKDGGFITISYDNGQNWTNIINDSALIFIEIPNSSTPDNLNLYSSSDTLYNGEFGFSGNSNDWLTTKMSWIQYGIKSQLGDTVTIRFNFISDSTETGNEGWMIDNIRLYTLDVPGSINEQNKLNFKVYPNPMKEFALIELDKQSNVELSIFNLYGQLIFQNNYVRDQSITIANDSFKSGTYFVKIKSEDNSIGVRKLIIK